MPPFRAELVAVDRLLSPKLLAHLRRIGHGHRLTIVDDSYDIPEKSKRLSFPGNSARALLAVARLIQIENDVVTYMKPDEGAPIEAHRAKHAFSEVVRQLSRDDDIGIALRGLYRNREAGAGPWFYDLADDPAQKHSFILATEPRPFGCVTMDVGHSQLVA